MLNKIKLNLQKIDINYKVELLVIAILTVSLILLGWAYIFRESNQYKGSVIESYSSNQELLVEQVSKGMKESLNAALLQPGTSMKRAEQTAVNDILKSAETSGSRYWFVYSSDGVIFEKNADETRNLEGKNLSDLIRYWKLNGGSGTETFEAMLLQGENGSAVFSKDNDIGDEIVSLQCIKVGDTRYYIGMSTLESYIMSISRVNEHILYLWTFSFLVSLDIFIFSLLLCLRIHKQHTEMERMNKSLTNKSQQIQELNRKLSVKSEAVQNASVYDSLTKLYNRKFFDNLLLRVNHELLQPVCIVVIDINGLGLLNSSQGYQAGDELLEKTSQILQRVCIDTDVVARTGSSEFTILMTGTKEAQAYGTAENIRRQFGNLDCMDLTLSIGVAQMKTKESSIFPVLEAARKNLILEKMMDTNSNYNSIITMLMATLHAYSGEAVAHSNRLKTMAVSLGKTLGMLPSEISRLAIAAQLHDVGKIGIPDSILNKREALEPYERDLIRRHSELGYNIVKSIPFLDEAAVDILHHHESYDGTGYPEGLKGNQITLNARIINIIDSFDAMTNSSVYAKTKTVEEAIHELRIKSSEKYDPHLVNEFIRSLANDSSEKREANE